MLVTGYPIRVVYLCTSPKLGMHAGGVKVIYEHCTSLNEMGVASAVLHEERGYLYPWALRNAPTISVHDLRTTDHVVLPEIKAAKHARLLVSSGMRYSIFVQNGYYICDERSAGDDLAFAYANATSILSISPSSASMIVSLFPEVAQRIVDVRCAIDSALFSTGHLKCNDITYMPRKNERHVNAVTHVLKRALPSGWRLSALDGLDERGVARAMQRSKIFMSFSDSEGLGLPPLEAALCGNFVIGYHGGGGRDYWLEPNFEEIEVGDIRSFVERVVKRAQSLYERPPNDFAILQNGITTLQERFSKATEQASLRRFIDMIGGVTVPTCSRPFALSKLQRRTRLRAKVANSLRWIAKPESC